MRSYSHPEAVVADQARLPFALEWLRDCFVAKSAHGSELVAVAVGQGWPATMADDLLTCWQAKGLIKPADKATPTESQLFLGYGGWLKVPGALQPPCFYAWHPIGPIWAIGLND